MPFPRLATREERLPEPYATLRARAVAFIPAARLVDDPLRLLAWGTDASFYRLVPKLAVVVESEEEVARLLGLAAQLGTPVTFRAAGTSLSGQAISDSVLVLLGDNWRRAQPSGDGGTIVLQPGVIGAAANRALAPFGRKIGPDPASIDAAMIGGIAANNASGMCCGTAQNSYRTLDGLRVVLADGSVLDTRDPASREAFRAGHLAMLGELRAMGEAARSDFALAARIRRKFALKNTTGYSLNALVDFEDPIDILAHLMIGSEGTLGFISEITYRTVPEHAHKASALILFDDLAEACRAVTLLKEQPVAAVELADRAALRSVEGKPGLPPALAAVGPEGAALLVETRAADGEALADQVARIEVALAAVAAREPARFSTDPLECARYWKVRKGMFPSVGAMRRTGTTTIIEDVAFPVPRLAQATAALQGLLAAHGYADAIIFGHALEGNLHFVFAQDFNTPEEVERYRAFMDALARMVVQEFDGSLKAEHGTGRNMAPFVELEWGAQAMGLMRRIKALADPAGLLNPGVILNADPQAHVKDLKPLPACDAIVDKCIECGFCEPKCPSRGLTLSPRQRIAGWREIARREQAGEGAGELLRLYDHAGIDTCAACGLCATACPVGIETGALIKSLRAQRAGPVARAIADGVAGRFAETTVAMRAGLGAVGIAHGLLSGRAEMLPRPSRLAPSRTAGDGAERVVYFPSCASRTFGSAHGDPADPLPVAAERLFRKAGFHVIRPAGLAGLCCGQPFESKGFPDAAEPMAEELERALREASQDGRWPIVFDTSPCAYRMRRHLAGRLDVRDAIEFVHDTVLPRLSIVRREKAIAIHAVCSVRKMGLEGKLASIAACCAERVAAPADVGCCGFAGDKGFSHPELNAHALRHLRASLPADCSGGYSSSRTCELGLSAHSGIVYRSIVHLVDACTEPVPA